MCQSCALVVKHEPPCWHWNLSCKVYNRQVSSGHLGCISPVLSSHQHGKQESEQLSQPTKGCFSLETRKCELTLERKPSFQISQTSSKMPNQRKITQRKLSGYQIMTLLSQGQKEDSSLRWLRRQKHFMKVAGPFIVWLAKVILDWSQSRNIPHYWRLWTAHSREP